MHAESRGKKIYIFIYMDKSFGREGGVGGRERESVCERVCMSCVAGTPSLCAKRDESGVFVYFFETKGCVGESE